MNEYMTKMFANAAARGEARGENKFSQLINFLLHAGRTDDIERAANDNVFRRSLFAEFGIA